MRSATAPLQRALLSEPAWGDFEAAGWLREPDIDLLRRQHAGFVELLTALGVDVSGVHTVTLRVTDGGDGKNFDHADWGDARVTCA